MAWTGTALPRVRVATGHGSAYRAPVSFRRILSMLLLVGLVLAPLGMMGGSPAMAMSGHSMGAMSDEQAKIVTPPCHDKQSKNDEQAPDTGQLSGNCCVMMCVAIQALGGQLAAPALPPQVRQALPLARDPHGVAPEADPPPPRFS